jgi:hypothetical protein
MSGDGRLIRVKLKFERDYTQIPNEWLRDPNLSLRARGLLALLMSHAEGFSVTTKQLVATNPEGETAIRAAVDELKRHRYLVVNKLRGYHGRIEGWTWELTDPAVEKSRSTPELDLPQLDEPVVAEPVVDNHVLKEAHSQEHLTKANRTTYSTRAGINEERSAHSSSAADAARCVAGHPLLPGTEYCLYACRESMLDADAKANA